MIRAYYRLAKPGIVYGNTLAAAGAFLFASRGHVDLALGAATILGIGLVIASACVVNNVIDRDIDARMERTKDRALPQGQIPIRHALLFALVLGLIGFGTLLAFTTLLAFLVTLSGAVVYVCLYTPAKRMTPHSTIIGAFAGAVPPVAGYAAVTGALDSAALCLFLVLVCWQMVHFFAIAIFRENEYRAAGLPVMPIAIGLTRTKALMITYSLLFPFSLYALYDAGHPGPIYGWVMSAVSLGWVLLCLTALRTVDTVQWARRMFFYSLAALLLFCITLSLP